MVVGGPVAAEDKARVDAVSDSDDEDDLIRQQLEVLQERWVLQEAGQHRTAPARFLLAHMLPPA